MRVLEITEKSHDITKVLEIIVSHTTPLIKKNRKISDPGKKNIQAIAMGKFTWAGGTAYKSIKVSKVGGKMQEVVRSTRGSALPPVPTYHPNPYTCPVFKDANGEIG